nr:hypothetical protein L203_00443 [Cryptococcus depauperatus CBS 7841]
MPKIPNQQENLVSKAENFVKDYMSKYDPSHDWAHGESVDRVRKLALKIANSMSPKPDLSVVELAALFHDVTGKYSQPDSPTLVELLQPVLAGALSQDQIDSIILIVPSVSYTAETSLLASNQWVWQKSCLELHAVQDADRLDAIGAIGILRCAAYSGATGRPLVETVEIGEESAEAHFEEKLLKVKERMKTSFGKEEAEKRHKTMINFLMSLQSEKEIL